MTVPTTLKSAMTFSGSWPQSDPGAHLPISQRPHNRPHPGWREALSPEPQDSAVQIVQTEPTSRLSAAADSLQRTSVPFSNLAI